MSTRETLRQRRETRPAKPASATLESRPLLSWHEIPDWQKDNEYVLTGYRRVSASLSESLSSTIAIHNETVSIQSHLFGAALFFILPLLVYNHLEPRYPSASSADVIVFSTFFFGVAICFLLSATFHIISNHSEVVAAFGNQLDYLGIVILMWGSTIPCVYYGFYCSSRLQKVYWAQVSTLALVCTIITIKSGFRTPKWRPFRSAMYAGLGLSFVVPIVHSLAVHGFKVQLMRMSLDWMVLMATFNLMGAVLYAMRVPEKWYPYTFDLLGSSHQILHFMVIFAGIAHMFGLLRAFEHLHSMSNPCG